MESLIATESWMSSMLRTEVRREEVKQKALRLG